MNKLKDWYGDALNFTNEHTFRGGTFIMYKGFKITKEDKEGTYEIVLTRESEFYQSISKRHLRVLNRHGFIKGCDRISLAYHTDEIVRLKKYVVEMYGKRGTAKRLMSQDVRLNTKRVKLLNNNISIALDQVFMHQSKISQLKRKK